MRPLPAEIEASPTEFTYQMEMVFDTEENRRRWAASAEHTVVWPLAAGMARTVTWRGMALHHAFDPEHRVHGLPSDHAIINHCRANLDRNPAPCCHGDRNANGGQSAPRQQPNPGATNYE